MPYCSQCAHALADSSRFCPACGAASVVPPAVAITQDLTRTSGPDSPAPMPPPTSEHGRFEPGTRLGTRYRIVGLLGRGGMGEVYRADDLELGQSVALKFLPPGVSEDPREVARFRGEVRIARQIAHPNVCRVYDIGESDGHVFLSMEYIDGEDLASVLRRMGRPTEDKAVEIARQVCLGLAAAHESGMLHRDLKPANIMIDGRGRARITDFGLAGLAVELANSGQIAGTPAYMAPEQLADGTVSVRSDLYSLGLVLYELFTGRRAFDAKSAAELREQQDSGSITSPSAHARGITPAVERLIMHCLERDAEQRPPSAYAVLGALPGGDPLAAAMAAGETPSPELVANATDRGGLAPAMAVGGVALVLALLGVSAALLGPEFVPLKQDPAKLSVRAEDVLRATGAFDAKSDLPKFSAAGFAQNDALIAWAKDHPKAPAPKSATAYYWRRWAPRLIESPAIHRELPSSGSPPVLGNSSAMVLLDPEGRVVGLRVEPPDSVGPSSRAQPAWNAYFAALGLDSTAYTRVPLARPVPALCDSAAAWRGPSPWAHGDTATVQMGISRGRLTHFTVVSAWGVLKTPVDELPPVQSSPADVPLVLYSEVLPLLLSAYFAMRNLQLGRGDWRGATTIGVFVFVMNILEAVFATRLPEVGIANMLSDLVSGRAFGHSLIHAMGMWFAYVALEPYVRRLWPRMLVSWARLITGRMRDPLVGRDLIVGMLFGALINALGLGLFALARHFGLTNIPALASAGMFDSISGIGAESVGLSWSGSVCVLTVLQSLFVLLLLRLLLRNTAAAVTVTFLLLAASGLWYLVPAYGWPVALLTAVLGNCTILLVVRFGLLVTVGASFAGLVLSGVPASLDFSSWYAGLILLPMVLLGGIAFYGAAMSLGGKSILGDPLDDTVKR